MDKTAKLYLKSAIKLGLNPKRLHCIDGFHIKLGLNNYYFRGGHTPFNQDASSSIAQNKYCTNKLLEQAGLPVCRANAFSRQEFKNARDDELIRGLTFPLVIKPTINGGLGRDVICNIRTIDELKRLALKKFKKHPFLSIENFHNHLRAYRVLIFNHKVIGVTERFSAEVVGDGKHTIAQLIRSQNKLRLNLKKSVSLGMIKVDDEYLIRLEELGLSLNDVPNNNERVRLCYNCNSTRGGSMHSLGNQIHVFNKKLLEKASRVLNLTLVGFDVLCHDIHQPMHLDTDIIVEANHNPDLTIHEHPMNGEKNIVSLKIMKGIVWKHPFSYLKLILQKVYSKIFFRVFLIIILFVSIMIFL